jgi:hypothetical protein
MIYYRIERGGVIEEKKRLLERLSLRRIFLRIFMS